MTAFLQEWHQWPWHYWAFSILLMIGFYAVADRSNLIKNLIGLSLFQSAVFLLYIMMGKVAGGTAPILMAHLPQGQIYSNPLPQVLILTAIVVGISTTAVGLAIVVRIQEAYGTVEEHEINAQDQAAAGNTNVLQR